MRCSTDPPGMNSMMTKSDDRVIGVAHRQGDCLQRRQLAAAAEAQPDLSEATAAEAPAGQPPLLSIGAADSDTAGWRRRPRAVVAAGAARVGRGVHRHARQRTAPRNGTQRQRALRRTGSGAVLVLLYVYFNSQRSTGTATATVKSDGHCNGQSQRSSNGTRKHPFLRPDAGNAELGSPGPSLDSRAAPSSHPCLLRARSVRPNLLAETRVWRIPHVAPPTALQ
eukprot:gene1211-biopygen22780